MASNSIINGLKCRMRQSRFQVSAVILGIAVVLGLVVGQMYPDTAEGLFSERTPLSPEVFNSAFAPQGAVGGAIIPASCSIGQPCDTATGDAFCPCAPINISFSQESANVFGGDYVPWNFSASNAATCDFTTPLVSPAGAGPAYNIASGPTSATYNAGPFANVNGTVTYRVTCYDSTRTLSAFKELTITTNVRPDTTVVLGGAERPFVAITNFSGAMIEEVSGVLNWEVVGENVACTATGGTGWSGTAVTLPTGSKYVYSGSTGGRRTYSLTCSNAYGTVSRTTSIFFEGLGGCFIPGTKVTMADGTARSIETIGAGDYVETSNGAGEVEKLWTIPYKGKLYAFNNSGNFFVTDSHPFMTTDGWKSFNPAASMKENPDLTVTLLEIGDEILRDDGTTEVLGAVATKDAELTVYNLKIKGETNDFFADGYWVHNAMIK